MFGRSLAEHAGGCREGCSVGFRGAGASGGVPAGRWEGRQGKGCISASSAVPGLQIMLDGRHLCAGLSVHPHPAGWQAGDKLLTAFKRQHMQSFPNAGLKQTRSLMSPGVLGDSFPCLTTFVLPCSSSSESNPHPAPHQRCQQPPVLSTTRVV